MIGSAFIRHARQLDCEILNLDLTEGVDVTNAAQVMGLIAGFDSPVVIHFAAYVDVSSAHKQWGDKEGLCYRLNVIGTRNVAAACAQSGKHLIHLSTDFVFDGASESPYFEDSPVNPIEWYGATKRMAEEEVFASETSWTIARIAFPYTSHPWPKLDLARTFLGKLRSGERVNAFDDQVITPTWIDDISEGLMLLANTRPAGEIYHLVGSESLTPYELALKISRRFECDASLVGRAKLDDILKIDPRPRQRCLRISNEKWSKFALRHGLSRPLTVEGALEKWRHDEGCQ
jgi:dTDP-4-dehydrorhamnose reductase